MRAIPSLTSRTVPTSSTSSSLRSAASISRSRMSLISPGRSVVSDAMGNEERGSGGVAGEACENYHKHRIRARRSRLSSPGYIAAWGCAQMHRMDGESAGRQTYFGPMPGATRETKVWQEAIGLAGDVIRVVRRATRRETKAFTDALMLSATAVASAVAEAATRANPSDERECYVRARRSLVTVETQLAI